MQKNGFSKVELFFAGLVIAVLFFFFMPRFFSSSEKSRYAVHQQQRRYINEKVEAYYFKYGSYPEAMTKEAWKGPDGADYTAFFEGSFPAKCPFKVHWTLRSGRVDMVPHEGHEGDVVISSDDHHQERVFINQQLKRFFETNKFYPESMTNAGWIGVSGESYTVYFQKGVPSTCINGATWEINRETGVLIEDGHEGHE